MQLQLNWHQVRSAAARPAIRLFLQDLRFRLAPPRIVPLADFKDMRFDIAVVSTLLF